MMIFYQISTYQTLSSEAGGIPPSGVRGPDVFSNRNYRTNELPFRLLLMHFNKTRFFGLLTIILFLSISAVYGQDTKDVNARAPVPRSSNAKQKKAEKKKEDQKKLKEKAIDKGRKRHEKLQTKDVRKRMKKSKRKAAANNAHQKEFFLKRWFTPDHKTKRR